MRTISIYLRVTDHATTEVTAQNRPKGERSFIIRNQPVTLRIGIFRHDKSVAVMTKAELEAEGWKTWLLNISKNHTLMYPVYIQPDYDYENPPITVSNEGIISVVLQHTDTEESAKAIEGMPGDMWEAELTGFREDDTALENPLAVLQWPIGYINRVADENADAPGLLESTYYTKEQVNELLRQIAPEGTWGHIIGDITDQEDLIALLEEKAGKATTLAGYGITDAYTKTEIDAKVASVYRYKGSVNAYSDLPTEDQQVGDVYNVVTADATHDIKAGDNVAWNGTKWDVLAGEIDLSGYIQKAEKGEPNGVPTLDENGKVPMSQMPVLQLSSPPTTSTVGSVGQLGVWHDSEANKNHTYHLCFISTSDNATLYHWEECVLESSRNVAGGFAGLDANGHLMMAGPIKVLSAAPTNQTEADFIGQLGIYTTTIRVQVSAPVAWRIFMCVSYNANDGYKWIELSNSSYYVTNYNISTPDVPSPIKLGGLSNGLITLWNGDQAGALSIFRAYTQQIDDKTDVYRPIVPSTINYAVRSVSPLITTIAPTADTFNLLDARATSNSHSHDFRHSPVSAPTYVLPDVPANNSLVREIVLEVEFPAYARSSDDDSGSAYAWKHGTSLLYTDTTTIVAGTTVAYSDAALTQSAGTIQAYQNDAIGLVISCSFEDTNETAIVPMSEPVITCGTVIDYLCRWSNSLNKWCIMPVVME